MIYNCGNCANYKNGFGAKCSKCTVSYPDKVGFSSVPSQWTPKLQTNADHIRAMSDEEMAVWLCAFTRCERCVAFDLCKSGGGHASGVKEWLKQPYKEERNENYEADI